MIQRTHAATWRAGGDVTRLHPCSLKPSTLRFHISNELRIVVEHGRGIRVPSRRLTSKVSVVWLARQVLIESLEHLRGRRAPAALGYIALAYSFGRNDLLVLAKVADFAHTRLFQLPAEAELPEVQVDES